MRTYFAFYSKEPRDRIWWLCGGFPTRSQCIGAFSYRFLPGHKCAVVEVSLPNGLELFDFAKPNIHNMPEACILTEAK